MNTGIIFTFNISTFHSSSIYPNISRAGVMWGGGSMHFPARCGSPVASVGILVSPLKYFQSWVSGPSSFVWWVHGEVAHQVCGGMAFLAVPWFLWNLFGISGLVNALKGETVSCVLPGGGPEEIHCSTPHCPLWPRYRPLQVWLGLGPVYSYAVRGHKQERSQQTLCCPNPPV